MTEIEEAGPGGSRCAPTRRGCSKQSLSPARRRLLEIMQETNFGRIERLLIRHGEPVLDPAPAISRDIVLGKVNPPNVAREKADFALKDQVVSLFDHFDRERMLVVESLTVQNGLPTRMTITSSVRTD